MKSKKQTAEQFQRERKKQMKLAYNLLKPCLNYDKEYDILYINFSGHHKCESTVELSNDTRVDINSRGMIIAIEICDFQKKLKGEKL